MQNTVHRTEQSGNVPAAVNSQYIRLLTDFAPVAIETDAEHERALKAVGVLMEKENRSGAETSLLKLLAVLIEDYEQDRFRWAMQARLSRCGTDARPRDAPEGSLGGIRVKGNRVGDGPVM